MVKTYSKTLEGVIRVLSLNHEYNLLDLDTTDYSLTSFIKAYNATGLRALRHLPVNPNPLDVKHILHVHWSLNS